MKKLHRLSIVFLKYIPLIGAIIMWVHVILLLCGINGFFAENLIGLPLLPYVTSLVWSKAFGFCRLHRVFLTYIFLVTICINYQSFFGFGVALFPLRWVMLILGILLFMYFIIFKIWKRN